jgi:hypothetical protein
MYPNDLTFVDELGNKNCNAALKPGTSIADSEIALATVDV